MRMCMSIVSGAFNLSLSGRRITILLVKRVWMLGLTCIGSIRLGKALARARDNRNEPQIVQSTTKVGEASVNDRLHRFLRRYRARLMR